MFICDLQKWQDYMVQPNKIQKRREMSHKLSVRTYTLPGSSMLAVPFAAQPRWWVGLYLHFLSA